MRDFQTKQPIFEVGNSTRPERLKISSLRFSGLLLLGSRIESWGSGAGIRANKMRTWNLISVLFFIFLALDWLGTVGSGAKTPQDEVDALKIIGKSLGKSNWNFSVDPCSKTMGWITPGNDITGYENNVTCNCTFNDNTVCHVISITLKSQNLTGVLPPELVRLRFLQNLDLTRNFLSRTIPPQWGSSRFAVVSLLGNHLSGTIPKELGNITSLMDLNIEANQFLGPVPPELGNLTNLERLLISSNPLTGPLPEALSKLSNMKDFRISDTNISGKIPDFIQNWSNLQKLAIQGCPMEGPIPSGISGLVKLTDLRISDINGTGSSFPDLRKLLNMKTLVLRNCLISGTIPDYIENMSTLKLLDLSFNNLTGKIPDSFGSLSKIDFMYFTSNRLTGPLPDWILRKNKNVDVSYNNLTWTSSGPNTCMQQTINLIGSYSSTMDSSANSCLKKDFPCAGSKDLYDLYINCGGKELTVDGKTYEADLEVRGASTSYISKDWAFSSTGNFMDNDQDTDYYIATNTSMLSMPHSELYATARLSAISLTYYGLCMMNGNYTVNLHFAEIMFANDTTFKSHGRRIFDVYIQGKLVLKDFNIEDAAGAVGKAVVENFTAAVTSNTLEIHFLWTGKGTQSIPRRGVYGPLISAISVVSDFVPPTKGRKISAVVVVAIVASVLCSILFVLFILWKAGWLSRKPTRENELRGLDLQTGSFTLRQIKAATNNFDPKNKIGEGGFGPVYKGFLADGTIIAVKQLSSKSKQGNREFVNEIGMITALQHPNLVKLYGCCIEGNQLSLIYEYMENNSLARALFHQQEGQLKLDWRTRRNICIGIARGLTYLHEESRLKIVHRDIKATNVLLDKDLNAKISDFGLAKLDEEENTHISTRIAGTLGYMAPEYAMRGYLTDKADVYSFGIVALEIVSGKSNTNYRPKEECIYLLDWAYVLQERGKLAELIDLDLGSDFKMEEAMRMLKVGLLCTNASPTLRPIMSSVVSMLEGRTVVDDDLISNVSSSNDDIMFKAIRNHSRQSQDCSQSHTQSMSIDGPWTGSSVSVPDLYPISMDSETWNSKKSDDQIPIMQAGFL